MKSKKIQLVKLLVDKKISESIEKANSLVLSGSVLVNDIRITKSGFLVDPLSTIRIQERIPEYVSRGAYKLIGALDEFSIDTVGKVCLDIGSSTGGFTQVLLQRDVQKVYCIDVGYGQLAHKLRVDPRVKVYDRTHAKNFSIDWIKEPVNEILVVIDVSFISVTKIFPTIAKFKESKEISIEVVSLIKPQFECEKEHLVKGVVKDPKVHLHVLRAVYKNVKKEIGGVVKGLSRSPIRGTDGNKEFFIHWKI
jgi:23S rRNA (cytidine1920-2'-O)/16S rRNA (cytidine1409-2'-O)-methyltransferase